MCYLQHYLPDDAVVAVVTDDAVVVVTDEEPQVGREMLEAPSTALTMRRYSEW